MYVIITIFEDVSLSLVINSVAKNLQTSQGDGSRMLGSVLRYTGSMFGSSSSVIQYAK